MNLSKLHITLLCGLLTPVTADAKNAALGPVLVSMTGHTTFNFGDAPVQETPHLMYMQIPKTGRAEFTVPTTAGVIGFSGGKDIQVSAEDYLLKIDSIVNGRADGTSDRMKATGSCKMKMSADGDHVYSVSCTADTEFGHVTLAFTGNGEKVTVLHPNGK